MTSDEFLRLKQTAAAPDRFEGLILSDFLRKKDVDVEWQVEKIIPRESVTIMAGFFGLGKSWLLMDMALDCALGTPWLSQFKTFPGPVVYIDEENVDGLIRKRCRKLLAARMRKGFVRDDTEIPIHIVPGSGLNLSDMFSVTRLRNTIKHYQPQTVIIDSLIRVHRSDENSATEMANIFGQIKGIVRDFKCSVIIADHHRKSDSGQPELNLRGSTEKGAFVDCLLSIAKKDDCLIIDHSKSRFSQPVPAFIVKISDSDNETETTIEFQGDRKSIVSRQNEENAKLLIDSVLADLAWHDRQEIVEKAADFETTVKSVDTILQSLCTTGEIEKGEKPMPEGHRGKKPAQFRKNTPLNQVKTGENLTIDEATAFFGGKIIHNQ